MSFQRLYRLVMVLFSGIGFDLFVHRLDHTIRPRMAYFRGSVINEMLVANLIKEMNFVLRLFIIRLTLSYEVQHLALEKSSGSLNTC